MKKFLILFLLPFLTNNSYSQVIDTSTSKTYVDYLKKSKNQQTLAWFVTGASAVVFALSSDMNNLLSEENPNTGLYILGSAFLAGGITLFVASSKNKKRGLVQTIFFKMENTKALMPLGQDQKPFPSVALRFKLSR